MISKLWSMLLGNWAILAVYGAILVGIGAYGYHRGAISQQDKIANYRAQLATEAERYRALSAQVATLGEKTEKAKARAKTLQAEAKQANLQLKERANNIYQFKATGAECKDVERLINQELNK